jgi:thiosulfate dehydrogenase [quinone] large subunit
VSTLVPGWPLAVFRIAFGLLYLDMALQKAPWRDFGWLRGFVENEIAHPTFPAVAAFLETVVLANFAFFGWMTFLVELALGLGLLFGLLTRLAGLGGFLWQVNIAVQAFNVPGEWYWIWVLLTLPQFCFAASGAGRVWGLDAWLTPAIEAQARAGGSWARIVRLAT